MEAFYFVAKVQERNTNKQFRYDIISTSENQARMDFSGNGYDVISISRVTSLDEQFVQTYESGSFKVGQLATI